MFLIERAYLRTYSIYLPSMYVCMYVCIYRIVFMYTCMYYLNIILCMYVCNVCMYTIISGVCTVCMYVCIYVYICMYGHANQLYLVRVNGEHSDESVAGSGEDGVVVQRQHAVDRLGVSRKP